PRLLEPGPDVSIDVQTEPEQTGTHGIWFNRGAIASRAYALKFDNTAPPNPEDPEDVQTDWLSRGLLKACLKFIEQTRKGESLRVTAYEFTYTPIFDALKDAIKRGVHVKIIYEAGKKSKKPRAALTDTTKTNRNAIRKNKFPKKALIPRTQRRKIPHNKFIVRLNAKGDAVAVWTGSTNFTESGFLGQSNVGHRLDDLTVARQYLKYWKLLADDPDGAACIWGCVDLAPAPDGEMAEPGTVTLVSPRSDKQMLGWYAARIGEAQNTVMFTAAFSVDPVLASVLAKNRPFLRFVLMEKPPAQKTQAI